MTPNADGNHMDELAGNIADLVVRKLNYAGQNSVDGTGPAAACGVDGNGQISDLVFVLSAFTPEMDPAYHAISAAAKTVGLRAARVKDVKGDYRITEQILVMIRQARLIVADLTNDRPNVYFELGFARGIGKKVITILRSGSQPHFDVYDWAYLEYIDSRPLEKDLLERFRMELRDG
jgi:nucleoside 2-deoxyribosyltransferase